MLGVGLIVLGLVISFGGRFFGLGRLPGDISVRRGNFSFYFPVATSLILSIVLTLLMWFLNRR